jgi:hypothetical protein
MQFSPQWQSSVIDALLSCVAVDFVVALAVAVVNHGTICMCNGTASSTDMTSVLNVDGFN